MGKGNAIYGSSKYFLKGIGVALITIWTSSPMTAAQNWIGSPRIPEGLNTQDLLMVEDFEGPNTLLDTLNATHGNELIVEDDAFDGKRALRLRAGEDKISEKVTFQEAVETAYARFMVKIVPGDSNDKNFYLKNWETLKATRSEYFKMFGFYGTNNTTCPGDFVSTGYDCWAVRSRFIYPHLGVFRDTVGQAGVDHHASNVDTAVPIADGQWHCLEMMVKMNTVTETTAYKDGQVRFWVDGKETAINNIMFRKSRDLQCNKWWWTWWSSDSFPGPMLFDSFVVSKKRVGCPNLQPVPKKASPPSTPRKLRMGRPVFSLQGNTW